MYRKYSPASKCDISKIFCYSSDFPQHQPNSRFEKRYDVTINVGNNLLILACKMCSHLDGSLSVVEVGKILYITKKKGGQIHGAISCLVFLLQLGIYPEKDYIEILHRQTISQVLNQNACRSVKKLQDPLCRRGTCQHNCLRYRNIRKYK